MCKWWEIRRKLKNERLQCWLTNPIYLFVCERPKRESWHKGHLLRNLSLILYIWGSLLKLWDNSLAGWCPQEDGQGSLATGSPERPAASESTGSVSDSSFSFSLSSCREQVLTVFSFVAETAKGSGVRFCPSCWCVLLFWAGTVPITKVLASLSTHYHGNYNEVRLGLHPVL